MDAVVWLPDDFVQRVSNGNIEAIERESMLLKRLIARLNEGLAVYEGSEEARSSPSN